MMTRATPCSCSVECDWYVKPKGERGDGDELEASAPPTGKAIAIGADACDALERAVEQAKADGRLVFASRLRALQGHVRKAAIEDVEREQEDRQRDETQRLEDLQRRGEVLFMLELPGVYTKNEGNARGHWSKRAEGVSDLRPSIEMAMRSYASTRKPTPFVCPFPCVVRLTRLCPPANQLDKGDNVSSALKRVRDGVADWMRLNDRSHLVEWVTGEEVGKGFGVRIEIIAGGKGA